MRLDGGGGRDPAGGWGRGKRFMYLFIISILGNADQLQEAECVCVTPETNLCDTKGVTLHSDKRRC